MSLSHMGLQMSGREEKKVEGVPELEVIGKEDGKKSVPFAASSFLLPQDMYFFGFVEVILERQSGSQQRQCHQHDSYYYCQELFWKL